MKLYNVLVISWHLSKPLAIGAQTLHRDINKEWNAKPMDGYTLDMKKKTATYAQTPYAPTYAPTSNPTSSPTSSPTSAPTSSPTSSPVIGTPYPSSHPTPSATCVDDSSWYKDDSTEKDCVWVGEKKNKRCSKLSNSANGMIPASSACKASCNTCFTPTTFPTLMPTPCGESDSTTWHKWNNPNKNCEWVSKRPKKRCSIGSKKVDGVWGNPAKADCRATCCDY